MGTVHWRKTDARYKKGFPMTVAVPTITDVVFDFCGVLLDWRTRACLEGRFDDATVDRICADPAFMVTRPEVEAILQPENFTGRSREQVEEYLDGVIRPLLRENAALLGEKQELNV